MKKTIIPILLAVLSGLFLLPVSCNTDYELSSPDDFEVSAASIAKVGEPVTFNLAGSPDLVMFYSGEFGHVFANRDIDILYPAKMSMSFNTVTSSVETPGMNPEKVWLKYSNDFSGEYTEEAVRAANWTDISDRFQWPTDQGQSIPSGEVSIDDIFPEDGKPVYFMFDFHVLAYDAETQPRGRVQWQIQNMVINGGTDLGINELFNHLTLGWNIVGLENYDACTSLPALPTASNMRLLLRTQFKPAVDIEFAAITCAIYSAEGINVGRNKGVSIKNFADPVLTSYKYTYDTAGEYDVTFAGINAGMNGNYEVPRTIHVSIVEDEGNIVSPGQGEWN